MVQLYEINQVKKLYEKQFVFLIRVMNSKLIEVAFTMNSSFYLI